MMAGNDLLKNFDRKTSGFRPGLVELLILIFILIAGLELYFDYNSRATTAHDNAGRLFAQASRNVQSKLKHIHDDVTLVLQSVRSTRDTKLLDTADTRSANSHFIKYLKQYPFITSVNIGDSDGNGYLILRLEDQLRNRITRGTDRGWVTWHVLDENGESTSNNRQRDSYDPRITTWYQNAVDQEGIVWSAPYLFRTTRDIGVTASMRLDSRKRGDVIGADIKLEDISSFFTAITRQISGMTAHLVTDDGTVIASSESLQLRSQLQQGQGTLPKINREQYPLVEKSLKSQGREKIFSFKSENRRFLSTIEPVEFSRGSHYKLVLTVPEDALKGTFLKDVAWKLLIELILLLVASAWYFSRRISPLKRINSP